MIGKRLVLWSGVAFFALTLAVAGCGKKEEPAPPPPAPAPAAPAETKPAEKKAEGAKTK